MRHYIIFFSLNISQNFFAPFNWDIRKNVPVLQVGISTSAPPTSPVIRVVLLHTEWFVQSFNSLTVFGKEYYHKPYSCNNQKRFFASGST